MSPEVELWDEDEEELDSDLDEWGDDDFEEWREEQESIRATFEHLMARDDVEADSLLNAVDR